MALKKMKGTLERVLDKNMQDLVRGIRNHKDNEAKYVAECIDEIKQELRQDNIAVKANAVSKLAYLQMLGYDISWAAFNIIEVMSSTKFTFKRIGYLAASQCFNENTDVLMLTTNMIRKDLSSQNVYDAGVALNGLSCFITPDLARDLANDLMTLMTSTRPYLRKKAVLIMYKVFLKFPEALRPAFPRLKEKLEDADPGVQSAAVNVICELARKNPKNYLSLAPLFFKLMTSSSNNWVLIKIIKLFSALTPLEPRLGKKLIEPLTNLIHSTSAMSLLYECINTVIAGIPNHSASIQLCVQKLRILIEDSDQNLKYLGLLAMSKILQTHPKSVQAHKDLVLQCLDDKDESIRLRALDLLYGMVSKKNLMEIVKKLMIHMDKAEGTYYRDELLAKIIEISSQSSYQFVTNFEWYVSVLVELTRMEGTRHGRLIASQMLDVAIRVEAIRPFAVLQMAILLENSHLLANNSQRNGICEVLYAAAWICGEFAEHLKEPKNTLEAMLKPKITALPGHIQSVYVQNIIKLYCKIQKSAEENEDKELMKEMGQMLIDKLPMFIQSADLEVQERACCMLQLVKYVMKYQQKGGEVAEDLAELFEGELNPVAPRAQKKVPVPEGLDLDEWINEPPSESSDDDISKMGTNIFLPAGGDDYRTSFYDQNEKKATAEPSEEELAKIREARKVEQMHNPHYLKGEIKPGKKGDRSLLVTDIPVSHIDLSVPLHVPGIVSSDKYLKMAQSAEDGKKKKSKDKKKKKKKGQARESEDEEDVKPAHEVRTVEDMPEGAELSDKDEKDENDPYSHLDVNLDAPLRDDERLPVRTHRIVLDTPTKENSPSVGKKREKHKKESKEKKKKRDKDDRKEKRKEKKKKATSMLKEEPNLLKEDHEQIEGENVERVDDTTNAGASQSPDTSREVQTVNGTEKETKADDLDFWLSGGDTASTPSPTKSSSEPPTAEDKPKKVKKPKTEVVLSSEEETKEEKLSKKKKKGKSSKKDVKEKKDKKRKHKSKVDYEEADGITTPSKEQIPASQLDTPVNAPPMSGYKLLAENNCIKMTYETRVTAQRKDQVVVSVVFHNQTDNQIKDLEFNVLDSINTKLNRGIGLSSHEAVKVPFILPPNIMNEGQFAFTFQSISQPSKLKGTLTYIVKTDDGSTHEKLDFRISFPCSTYILATPCNGPDFASLLSSGELSEKGTAKCTPLQPEFSTNLLRICFYNHFKVVERVDNSASLYSRSIQGHHICLLVKQVDQVLSIDGKSTDSSLLSNVLDEIKITLTEAT
ncbi:hypothetical protein ACJMK2_041656 [Sinanodonta woodiana]|uniref:AP-3 complex subunit delta domain-containing protein n=1 Tax=Sinanodonta woodiana TaxID=1069815 RepID=A0ABD3W8L8_SINWO